MLIDESYSLAAWSRWTDPSGVIQYGRGNLSSHLAGSSATPCNHYTDARTSLASRLARDSIPDTHNFPRRERRVLLLVAVPTLFKARNNLNKHPEMFCAENVSLKLLVSESETTSNV